MSQETMPGVRSAITRKFRIPYVDEDGVTKRELKFYVHAGMYEDKRLGELFIRGDKVGSFITGALDALAMTISVGLQHGVPLEMLTSKLRRNQFGPSGFLGAVDKEFTSCTSAFDLLAQWLDLKFPGGKLRDEPIGRESTPLDPAKETP